MEWVLGLMVAFLIGWAFAWVLWQSFGHKCPECRGAVSKDAKKCRHCGTDFGATMADIAAEKVREADAKAREAFLRKKAAHPWLYWEFSGTKLAIGIVAIYASLWVIGAIWHFFFR